MMTILTKKASLEYLNHKIATQNMIIDQFKEWVHKSPSDAMLNHGRLVFRVEFIQERLFEFVYHIENENYTLEDLQHISEQYKDKLLYHQPWEHNSTSEMANIKKMAEASGMQHLIYILEHLIELNERKV